MAITHKFKEFSNRFQLTRDIQKAIEFYSVFAGGFDFCEFNPKNTLIDEIEIVILNKRYLIESRLESLYNFNDLELELLIRVAKSNAKDISTLKRLRVNSSKARETLNRLIKLDILKIELSRERVDINESINPKQKIKRHLRKYKIENRIKFKNNFLKFYFRFIITKFSKEDIEIHLDEYISFIFEDLTMELFQKIFRLKMSKIGSYWDRLVEIDIYMESKDISIFGECKWTNTRVCKKLLNDLHKKCELSNLNPNQLALISKSGFSNELQKREDVLLLSLEAFEMLLR